MKALKNLGYLLLLGVLGLALVGLYLPSSAAIERRVTIAATPNALFQLLEDPQSFPHWSPWSNPGADVRYAFDGPASGVGSSVQWEGGAFPMSSGSYTITRTEPDRRVSLRLQLPLLGKTQSTLEIEPSPEAGRTQVVWRFYDDVGFNLPRRVLWLLADVTLGPQFERGLGKLRAVAERR